MSKGNVTISEARAAFEKEIRTFLEAVKDGDQTLVANTLARPEFSPNVADETGQTALWFAVANVDLKMVELLLEQGAFADYEDDNESRPIVKAMELGDAALPIMKKLLEQKGEDKVSRQVNLHAKQKSNGNTLLHRAAWIGWEQMMNELLATGAYAGRLEEMNHQGQTVMHLAAMRSPKKIVELLKEAGAAVNAHEKNGRRLSKETPADLAESMGRKDNAEYLLSLGGMMNTVKFGAKMNALRGKSAQAAA